jgi:hypothetical protein
MKRVFLSPLIFVFLQVAYSQSPLPKLGVRPTSKQALTRIPEYYRFMVPLPQQALPRDTDLSSNMPPAGDQGKQGACAAFSTVYDYLSYLEKVKFGYSYYSHGAINSQNVFSPRFIYNNALANATPPASNCEGGIQIDTAFDRLRISGAPPLSVLPYHADDSSDCLNIVASQQVVDSAAHHKILAYGSLPYPLSNLDYVKKKLASGTPVVIVLNVDTPFYYDGCNASVAGKDYYWTRDDNRIYGLHAMVCTGYDDRNNGYFKVLNSWGDHWGNRGYFFVSYSNFLDYVTEFWFAVPAKVGAVPSIRLLSDNRFLKRRNHQRLSDLLQQRYQKHPGRWQKDNIQQEKPLFDDRPDTTSAFGNAYTAPVTEDYESWLIPGHYRVIHDLRVGLLYLDHAEKQIVVSFYDPAAKREISTALFDQGETKAFQYNGTLYTFSFESVGSDEFPSKEAAFFSLQVTPKK